jgi:hypothetical protein
MTIMVVFGLGLGGNMQPLILAVQNAVSPREMGVATSSATFFRQVGGTLGTAVFLSILFSTAGDNIAKAFRDIVPTPGFQAALRDPAVVADPANAPVVDLLRSGQTPGAEAAGVLDDSSFLTQLDERLARPFLVGFSESMDLVFLVGACILALTIVVVAFLPELELRTSSGLDAARQEEQDEADEADRVEEADRRDRADRADEEQRARDDAADAASAAAGAAGAPTP